MQNARSRLPMRVAGLVAGAFLMLLAAGCGDSGTAPAGQVQGSLPASEHPHVPLLDRFGNQLTANSTQPYSPRRTCGACHDLDTIANGYHFQQGRTNTAGDIQTKDDFFGDGRTFLKSPGMYGKW